MIKFKQDILVTRPGLPKAWNITFAGVAKAENNAIIQNIFIIGTIGIHFSVNNNLVKSSLKTNRPPAIGKTINDNKFVVFKKTPFSREGSFCS